MRKGSLIGLGVVSAIIVAVVIIASLYSPGDSGLTPGQNGAGDNHVSDNDSKATSAGTILQVMTLRTDLSGNKVTVDRPFFLQLRDSSANGILNATELLKVTGASSADVDVRTFDPSKLMTPWSPVDTPDGVEGTLYRSGNAYFDIDNDSTVLIMVTISIPGAYSISVNATDTVNGSALAPPVTMQLTVESAAAQYLFTRPVIDTEYSSGWMQYMDNGSSMPFTIGAGTTGLWKSTRGPITTYDWTVTVIDPDGLIAYDDLVPYNQGIATVDPTGLVNTSVDSTWSWGINLPYHVVWDHRDGVRLEGSNITTPNMKEITQGGTQAAWADGTWEPSGYGEMTFHQAGHYIFLLTLTKNGQAVSAPLVLETIVS